MGERQSTGFWIDKDDLAEFDAVATEAQDDPYSRSQAIKNALAMQQTVLETMDELGWDVEMAEPSKRHTVRDALMTKDRIESVDDDA